MKHALLFAGWVKSENEMIRYSNNIGFMYKVLVEKLGYAKEHITVMFTNGRQINYGGYVVATQKANKNNFVNVLESYKELQQQDQLFIFITNHGGVEFPKKVAYIHTYSADVIKDAEFVKIINKVGCQKIIVFGQCYGGNMALMAFDKAVVISATSKGEESMSRPSIKGEGPKKPDYDEFVYHFIAYYNGKYPDGKKLNAKWVGDQTIYDAFMYAKQSDHWFRKKPRINGIICYENPQITWYGIENRGVKM